MRITRLKNKRSPRGPHSNGVLSCIKFNLVGRGRNYVEAMAKKKRRNAMPVVLLVAPLVHGNYRGDRQGYGRGFTECIALQRYSQFMGLLKSLSRVYHTLQLSYEL